MVFFQKPRRCPLNRNVGKVKRIPSIHSLSLSLYQSACMFSCKFLRAWTLCHGHGEKRYARLVVIAFCPLYSFFRGFCARRRRRNTALFGKWKKRGRLKHRRVPQRSSAFVLSCCCAFDQLLVPPPVRFFLAPAVAVSRLSLRIVVCNWPCPLSGYDYT